MQGTYIHNTTPCNPLGDCKQFPYGCQFQLACILDGEELKFGMEIEVPKRRFQIRACFDCRISYRNFIPALFADAEFMLFAAVFE